LDPNPDSGSEYVLNLMEGRRMVRDFQERRLKEGVAKRLIDAARYAPRAGNTEGIRYLLLEGDNVCDYWDVTLPKSARREFPWPGLLKAPTLIVVWASSTQYLSRYGEADKEKSGLGNKETSWSTPYWWVDGGMASMSILLAAESQNLGALFFGLFEHESAVKSKFHIPDEFSAIGTIAIGYAAEEQRKSKSTLRDRLPVESLLFRE
tara:strand:- start:504 stop:1124 length:621 start_codon:yes stop_codon:yes gene_type:complete